VVRAIAVSCVLVAHICSALNRPPPGRFYGGFGVALFFVHTSLVLMWSLQRRPNTLDFYIRRVARIYPLAIFAVVAVVLIHAPVGNFQPNDGFFHYLPPTPKQFINHILLIQNFFSGNFILYPMWSLPLEIQMYVTLPVLFFFLRKNMTIWPLLLIWALAAGFAHKNFGPDVVNLAVSIPYFIPGLMAYVGFNRRKATFPGWSFLLVLAAITWVGGHIATWQQAWWPALALGLLLPSFLQLRESVLTKVCWHIARYSYGIYLMHPFSIVLAFLVCRNSSWPIQYSVLFGSLAILSIASFHLIEAPFMRLGAKAAAWATSRQGSGPSVQGSAT
jgi:peptidoglycan/LPS O-acetylase OafA/YrhL